METYDCLMYISATVKLNRERMMSKCTYAVI